MLLDIRTVTVLSVVAGAIFDKESTVCRTAFRYEAEQHNNSTTSRFKLDRYEKDVDVLGNFELSRAGNVFTFIHGKRYCNETQCN